MKKNLTVLLIALVCFVVGSTKGDDLLESFTEKDTVPLGEKVASMDRPLNAEEIKKLGMKVMGQAGHDLSGVQHVSGMTTDHGYVITALGEENRFIAQCFVHSDLNQASCSPLNE